MSIQGNNSEEKKSYLNTWILCFGLQTATLFYDQQQ